MVKRSYSKHVWGVVCTCGVLGLMAFVLLVVHRNAGAARARRAVPAISIEDINPSPHAFTTHRLPTDDKFMCSVGNGHIATDVFSTTVFMNGLYNGAKGLSHRARIPSWANIRLNSTLGEASGRVAYTLDTRTAAFQVHVDRDWSTVEQKIYAHRYYTRAIVNQITITAKMRADLWRDHHNRYVDLSFIPGPDSDDINFESPVLSKVQNRLVWSTCGRTKYTEDKVYQETGTEVCAYWTLAPSHLVVPRRGKVLHTFVMTADTNKEVALKEMDDILQEKDDDLFFKHKKDWRKLNDVGSIEIDGNLHLAKTVNAIWYYLRSSLPSVHSNQPQGLFYGLSPGGLSRGGLLKDYEGHNFWDTELWMFPPILVLHPDLASILLRYRIALAPAAADQAASTFNRGIRYPWESAFTGREVTQPCCPEVADFEHHITGCIAYAARQYISVTGDEQWLKDGGCSMIMHMAEFWASRAKYNDSSGFYDIKNVMGPDEDHSNVTNSAFTNVVAGYSLYLGEYATCLCGFSQEKRARSWAKIAGALVLPYDPKLDYHPQFEGYIRPNRIKQADVILLGFPLQYAMNQSTKANDLNYYERVTRETGPAMTWSMHCIGHLKIGNTDQANQLFTKSHRGYVREPFKTWTEYKKPRIGAVNFLTGMGGFLQAIMFGYAGINIHLDRMEILNPKLIPESTRLKITGIHYLGSVFTLDIHQSSIYLKVTSIDEDRPLILKMNKTDIPLKNDTLVVLAGGGPYVIRGKVSKCPMPLDLIGQFNNQTTEATSFK